MKQFSEQVISKALPERLQKSSLSSFFVDNDVAKASAKIYAHNDFSFSSFSLRAKKPHLMESQSLQGKSCHFLQFNLGAKAQMFLEDKKISFENSCIMYGIQHENFHGQGLYEDDKLYKNCFFLFCEDFFLNLFKDFNPKISLKGISYEQSQISVKQRLLLHDIAALLSSQEDFSQNLLLESKVLELLFLLSPKELEPCKSEAYKAQELLLKNMDNPPSIKELAKLCATNEFKLKNSFKETFGSSIYAHLAQKRLEKAAILLEDLSLSVSEVASMVGYTNLSHFSKIYKARFGHSPRALTKR